MAVLEGDVQPVEVKAGTPSKCAKKKNGSREAGREGGKSPEEDQKTVSWPNTYC